MNIARAAADVISAILDRRKEKESDSDTVVFFSQIEVDKSTGDIVGIYPLMRRGSLVAIKIRHGDEWKYWRGESAGYFNSINSTDPVIPIPDPGVITINPATVENE